MRKLAREAVIFMLVAAVVGAIGFGVHTWNSYRINYAILSASATAESKPQVEWDTFQCDDGTEVAKGKDKTFRLPPNCLHGQPVAMTVVDTTSPEEQQTLIDLEKYGVKDAPIASHRLDILLGTGVGFGVGFPVGLIFWLLYRLVRFAVQG